MKPKLQPSFLGRWVFLPLGTLLAQLPSTSLPRVSLRPRPIPLLQSWEWLPAALTTDLLLDLPYKALKDWFIWTFQPHDQALRHRPNSDCPLSIYQLLR